MQWWCFSVSQPFHQSDCGWTRGRKAFVENIGSIIIGVQSSQKSLRNFPQSCQRAWGWTCLLLFSLDCARKQVSFSNFQRVGIHIPEYGPWVYFPHPWLHPYKESAFCAVLELTLRDAHEMTQRCHCKPQRWMLKRQACDYFLQTSVCPQSVLGLAVQKSFGFLI